MVFNIDNERPDIQRAYHASEDEKREAYYESLRIDIPIARCAKSEEGAVRLSDAVRELVENGGGRRLFFKENLYLDVDWDELPELITTRLITPEGWDYPLTDSDNLNIDWHEPGSHQIEISVELFDPTDD
jgi:type II restriction/modification system DNA methylase subunit YeeA